ncbi:MAG: FkbM family methyltransferase, partial [Solirubrobacterales bacterium]|nr:FkbM family methyltransferase [Solirubrobacterales bacterium]
MTLHDGARRLLRRGRIDLIAKRICADGRSRGRLVELLEAARFDPPGEPEPIALRALGGAEVFVRLGSSDPDVLVGAFHGRYHLPSTELPAPRLIWDLGANIGLTMRQMAAAFPAARVVGVELDPANLDLARRNLEPVAERIELVEGAVWPEPGTVEYGISEGDGEDAFRVGESGGRAAQAITLDELRERFGDPDYVKMDIEGAECEVLARNTSWAAAVPLIGVEYHRPYALE